jgi:hypothetical protein
MSGYQVTTPNWFAIQSPALIAQSQIVELLAHYWKPYETEYTTTGTTFTSESVLAGCINVSNTSSPSFATPSAALLIAAIVRRKTALQGVNTIPLPPALRAANNSKSQNLAKPCFSFPVLIHNQSASQIVLIAGSDVVIGAAPSVTILGGQIGYLMVTVEENVSVDSSTPNEVYITVIAP